MASSGNFCTLSPIAQLGTSTDASTRAGGMSGGNLKYVNQTGNTAVGTFGVTSGKWYFEVYINSFNADNGMSIGYVNDLFNLDAELGYNSPSSPTGAQAFAWYAQTNNLIYGPGDGGGTYNKSWGGGTKVTNGDIVGIYLDADNGKFWASKNGTVFNSGNPSAGTGHGFGTGGSPHNIAISSRTLYPAIGNWSAADATVTFNFGQDSTFGGAISAGGNADDNGFGDFKYAPSTGFLALCSANLPISDDIDPAQTDDDFPSKQFNVVTYTGNGSTQSISNLGFSPDMVWIKERSGTQAPSIYDSNRGVTKRLKSSATEVESTVSNGFTAFDSDGFSLGAATENNDNSETFVAWCWRANGGTTSSNSDGSITTTLQVGKGFSIGTYTGTGSNATVGHGLGAVPDFTLFKRRDASGNWVATSQKNMSSNDHNLYLQLSNTESDGNYFQNTAMTSSVISIGTHADINGSSNTYVMYNWINVEGYQKFGTYEGNNNTDGPFVYTGFRPRMLCIKGLDEAYSWFVFDSARNTFNLVDKHLRWDGNDAEITEPTGARRVDFLSNGFKVRASAASLNGDGDTYLYMAWGDVPFKYNNTF